jgi:LPPG:FO 2-phospho-L-lactate transferase
MARALRAVLDPGRLTVVVNVGDDTERYGVRVSPDPDTVLYTLAGVEGPAGWGRRDDTLAVMNQLATFGVDTSFALGDTDLALCIARSMMLERGLALSSITKSLALDLGITDVTVLPATDDPLRTFVQTAHGQWMEFQEYFVERSHTDEVAAVAYHGSVDAQAAPGVLEAVEAADVLVIAPSNPPLSIWPILAVDEIASAVARHARTVAVSPLFGGAPLKGPADVVMRGVGLSPGTRGILESYAGSIGYLFVDEQDRDDVPLGDEFDVTVIAADTRLGGPDSGAAFATLLLEETGS